MNEVTDLTLRRKARGSSEEVTPEEALRMAAADIRAGKVGLNPTKALILLIEPGPKDYPHIVAYRSDITFADELALLEIYKQRSLHDWAQEAADAE